MNFGAEKVDLRDIRFTPEILRSIPPATARMYSVIPIADAIEGVVIAAPYPFKLEAIDELRWIVGRNIEIRAADSDQLRTFIEKHYGADTV